MADLSFLSSLYAASSIFGVGVVMMDFLGLLGEHHHDGVTHDSTPDHGGSDHPGGSHEAGNHVGSTNHTDTSVHDADTSSDHDEAAHHDITHHEQTDQVTHTAPDTRGLLVLSTLRYLRSLVYFCVGFGPIGLLALWKGYIPSLSLLWSVPAGVGSVFVVRRILRFQTKETDSSLHPEDIIFSKATVLVPLSKGSMGKVRIHVGIGASEQYALPKHGDESFEKGDTVYIASVGEECVYVESEERFMQGASR